MELNSIFQAANSGTLEFVSNYPQAMSWDQRLRDGLAAKGWTKAELGRKAEVPYDSVNKYLAGEVKQPRGDTLDRLARALDMDPIYLAKGVDPVSGAAEVPVMGYVGAGAEVEPDYEQVPPEGLFQVTVPIALPAEMIAYQVRGDSMLPQFQDGMVIIVFREQRRALETFYGEQAVVRTVDGRRFIKTIERGAGRGVTLRSWNAKPIEDVALDWIGEIFTYFPASAIQREARRSARQGGLQGQLSLKVGG